MCGICGTVAFAGELNPEADGALVDAMMRALGHRGHDDLGKVVTPLAILGATRLAIRGLKDGAQPMVDAQTGVVAACNGEIDNHRELRTWLAERGRRVAAETDVAVIPGLYLELGEDFVSRLAGAFAIAVWDPAKEQLLLARDRAGERPLFFAAQGSGLAFATEVAALVSGRRSGVSLDQRALRSYLQFGIFPSPEAPFAEIRKVAPGETLQVDRAGIHRKRYWRWEIVRTRKQAPSVEALDRTFREAVLRQSDVDVDFGVFLSGGLDSSLVSAVTRSLYPSRPLKAYTLRFREASFDEGSFAETIAQQLNMELASVWVRPEDIPEGLKGLVNLVGEPLADPAWVPAVLLARRAAQDVRMALVGEGADELFGGYPTYIGASIGERYARVPAWTRSLVRHGLEALPRSSRKMPLSFLLRRFAQGADLEPFARHLFWVSNIQPALQRQLGALPAEPEGSNTSGELLDRVQEWDLEKSLAEGLLTKADRASMSATLELRAPFLDKAVMEFAASVPVRERVRGFHTKVLLKRYALKYLPERTVYRRKRGLSVPLQQWLRGPLRAWAASALDSGRLELAGIRPAAAKELLAQHCEGKADHARPLWTLLVLDEWLNWATAQNGLRASSPATSSCDTQKVELAS
jgi:asparagine synthase (glutamine-hydrolysing)